MRTRNEGKRKIYQTITRRMGVCSSRESCLQRRHQRSVVSVHFEWSAEQQALIHVFALLTESMDITDYGIAIGLQQSQRIKIATLGFHHVLSATRTSTMMMMQLHEAVI